MQQEGISNLFLSFLCGFQKTVELGYAVMIRTEYFVSLWSSVFVTEKYNVMVNSDEVIGTTEYITL
jgi:hypothetical protein